MWSNMVLLLATESLTLPAELGVERDGVFQPFIFELCWIMLVSYLNIKIHNIHIHIDVHIHIHIHLHTSKAGFFYREVKEPGFFRNKNATRDPLCRNPEFSREISEKTHLSWAMKQGSLVVEGIFGGCHPTQLYGDYFINHEIRIPIKLPGFHGK